MKSQAELDAEAAALRQGLQQGAQQANSLSNSPVTPPPVLGCGPTQKIADPITGCEIQRAAQAGDKAVDGHFLEKKVGSEKTDKRSPEQTLQVAEPVLAPYLADRDRFIALATDPAHIGSFGVPGLFEAMAGLAAETQKLLPAPIKRGPKEIEF